MSLMADQRDYVTVEFPSATQGSALAQAFKALHKSNPEYFAKTDYQTSMWEWSFRITPEGLRALKVSA